MDSALGGQLGRIITFIFSTGSLLPGIFMVKPKVNGGDQLRLEPSKTHLTVEPIGNEPGTVFRKPPPR